MLSLLNISNIIKSKDYFYILTHMYPDGDALGSSFALCRAIQKMGKHAKVLCNDPVPEKFKYMQEYIKEENFNPEYIIALDLADTSLLGENLEKYKNKINLCIDHHISNKKYAPLFFIDSTAAATCEIIYRLFLEINITLTKEIASCLYTGIATDTGCFQYSNTTYTTHFIAGKLIQLGAPTDVINKHLFITKSRKKLELEKVITGNLEYFYEGKCAVTHITQQEMKLLGVNDGNLEGIASIPIRIEGVEIGITIKEIDHQKHKVSVRTLENIDANEFCKYFRGGGHTRAGGFHIDGKTEDVKSKILNHVKKILEKNDQKG